MREAGYKAHATKEAVPEKYQQHILNTPDFYDVVPDAPSASTMSAGQANYWKARYTSSKGEPGNWPAKGSRGRR